MDQSPTQPAETDELPTTSTRSHRKEFIATFVVCLGPTAIGTVLGYTSPTLPEMKATFHFDDTVNSWIGSLAAVGGLVGASVSGMAADFFGRKSLLMHTCLPFVVGWIFIVAAQNTPMLYAGRFITGFCAGILSMCAPTYVTEIASVELRGKLGSFFQLFINFGVLVVFLVGSYVPWNYLALLAEIFPILLLFLMIPLPEPPYWLVRQQRHLDAVNSILWLRGTKEEAIEECLQIQIDHLKEPTMSWRQLTNPLVLRPFLIMTGQMFIQQTCGINAIVFNAVDIFHSANQTMNSHVSGIIVGVFMLVASVISYLIIDLAGRRVLLLISAALMAVGMITLDTYYYLASKNPSAVEHFWWIPIICLVGFVFFFTLGFGPIPWLMMGEVFPNQARGIAVSLISAISWTLSFIVTRTFTDIKTLMGPFGCYWLFGGVCLFGVVFVYFCVPETRGKTLEEVQLYFIIDKQEELLISSVNV